MVRAYFVRGVGLAAAALDGREGACAGEGEEQDGGNGELHDGGVCGEGRRGGGVVIYTRIYRHTFSIISRWGFVYTRHSGE